MSNGTTVGRVIFYILLQSKQEPVRHEIHLEIKRWYSDSKKIFEWGRSLVYKFPQFPSDILFVTLASFPHILTIPAIVSFLGNSGESVKINKGQLIAIMLCTRRDY